MNNWNRKHVEKEKKNLVKYSQKYGMASEILIS